jgi:hypothetical protein
MRAPRRSYRRTWLLLPAHARVPESRLHRAIGARPEPSSPASIRNDSYIETQRTAFNFRKLPICTPPSFALPTERNQPQ